MIILANGGVWIDAQQDYVTCPQCRTCVPQGMSCGCVMRTKGPSVENQTRKILTEENDATKGPGQREDAASDV